MANYMTWKASIDIVLDYVHYSISHLSLNLTMSEKKGDITVKLNNTDWWDYSFSCFYAWFRSSTIKEFHVYMFQFVYMIVLVPYMILVESLDKYYKQTLALTTRAQVLILFDNITMSGVTLLILSWNLNAFLLHFMRMSLGLWPSYCFEIFALIELSMTDVIFFNCIFCFFWTKVLRQKIKHK